MTNWKLPAERTSTCPTPDDLVARREGAAAMLGGALTEGVRVVAADIGGVGCVVCEPASPRANIVWFHGGGYRLGTADGSKVFASRLAAVASARIVMVDYRLAPEHPFPAAVGDAWAATQWVAEHAAELGADPERLVVAGDSAGGNLAAVVALRARDAGLRLALQVLIYPVTDADLDSSGYARLGEGLNLTRAKMEWYWRRYLDGADGVHPDASPLRAADLAGVAPALVQTAEYDPLGDEGADYAHRLREAGVPVTLTQYDGQVHGFIRLRSYCGEQADEAIAEIASAIQAARPASR